MNEILFLPFLLILGLFIFIVLCCWIYPRIFCSSCLSFFPRKNPSVVCPTCFKLNLLLNQAGPKVRKPEPKQGVRNFRCEKCGQVWETPCRDHTSDSSETCSLCYIDAHPVSSNFNPHVEVDRLGNLIDPPVQKVLWPGREIPDNLH